MRAAQPRMARRPHLVVQAVSMFTTFCAFMSDYSVRRVFGHQLSTDDEDTDSDDEPSSYDLMMQGPEATRDAAKKPSKTGSPTATPEPHRRHPTAVVATNEETIEEPTTMEDPIEEEDAGNDLLEQDAAEIDHVEQDGIEESDVKPKLVDYYGSDDDSEQDAA